MLQMWFAAECKIIHVALSKGLKKHWNEKVFKKKGIMEVKYNIF